MYVVFTVLIILVCLLLIGIVLIQNPKGGGVGAGFGGDAQQMFGARRSNDIVEKGTWYLAIALLVLSLGSAAFINRDSAAIDDSLDLTEEVQAPALPSGGQLPPADAAPTGGDPLGDPQ